MVMISPEEEARLLKDWQGADATHQPLGNNVHRSHPVFPGLEAQQPSGGWQSVEQMVAAIERVYPEGSQGRALKTINGVLHRQIQFHTGDAPVGDADGLLRVPVVRQWVPVALTQEAARKASTSGVRTDYFNGWTWVKAGIKNERDGNVMQADRARDPLYEVAYVVAPEADQIRYRAQVAAKTAALGVPPIMPAGGSIPASPTPSTTPSVPGRDGGLPVEGPDPAIFALLSTSQRAALRSAGYTSDAAINGASEAALLAIPGIGAAVVEKIRQARRA